ncbi:unnamed protein product [Spirodela intermedia]|uniref:Peroxiredoxin n=1 Tax=Spirodela intermedia TaxID=51605 RepID=A0A7I8IA55_SPIIN|nr:unnamed protein product [Spirodela intermedia]CAA6653922.1 unnamed protein product [Spirodela intermedia]
MPGLTIGDTIPNLEVETTHGRLKLHEYVGDGWAVIFSDPGGSTPELAKMAQYENEFRKRGVKLLGVSCGFVDPFSQGLVPGCGGPAAGGDRELNMVEPEDKDDDGRDLPSRALHVVAADKRIKLSIVYPAVAGQNAGEVVRAVDSLQATARHRVATPVNWKPGEPVVISPSVPKEEADRMFPQGYHTVDLPSKKSYLRLTKL